MPDASKETTTKDKFVNEDPKVDNSWIEEDRKNEEKKRKDADKEGGAYTAGREV